MAIKSDTTHPRKYEHNFTTEILLHKTDNYN